MQRPQHNPDRCHTQFHLVESIARQEEAMRKFADGMQARAFHFHSGGAAKKSSRVPRIAQARDHCGIGVFPLFPMMTIFRLSSMAMGSQPVS